MIAFCSTPQQKYCWGKSQLFLEQKLIVITKYLFFLHCSIIMFLYIPQFSFSHLAGALEIFVMKHTSKPFLVPLIFIESTLLSVGSYKVLPRGIMVFSLFSVHYLSTYLSIHPSIHPYNHLSIYSSMHTSIHDQINSMSSVTLSIRLSVHPSIQPSGCPSILPSIHPSMIKTTHCH